MGNIIFLSHLEYLPKLVALNFYVNQYSYRFFLIKLLIFRTSNQNFHSYLKIQNKSLPNNDLENIPTQNNHPTSILSSQKSSTVLQTNSEHHTVKFSKENSDIIKAAKRAVTFNFTEDIYINSEQCKIIVEQKNGCLKDPTASVSRFKSFFHMCSVTNINLLINCSQHKTFVSFTLIDVIIHVHSYLFVKDT